MPTGRLLAAQLAVGDGLFLLQATAEVGYASSSFTTRAGLVSVSFCSWPL